MSGAAAANGGRMYRTAVQVVRVEGGAVVGLVTCWPPGAEVRVPVSSLPEDIRAYAVLGSLLMAEADLGAPSADGLRAFEMAPEPGPRAFRGR